MGATRYVPPSGTASGAANRPPQAAGALEKDILALEREVGVEQEGNLLERAGRAVLGNPAVKRVLDIVSRPNYAIAGAYEEMAAGRGQINAGARLFRELLSGVGSLQGEKQGFGEVFEDLGYGAGGSLSGLAPFAFSETGEGARFKRNGFFDWTARGSLGTALDIALDPTTYMTFGAGATARRGIKAGEHFLSAKGLTALTKSYADNVAKGLTTAEADMAARTFVADAINGGAKHLADQGGVKLFGATVIPGEVFSTPARSVSDGVVKFMHKTSMGEGLLEIGEGVGKVFGRDFMVRKHPEYISRKQLYLTTVADQQRNLRDLVEDLYRGTTKEQRAQVTNFIDSGGKTALDPMLAPMVKKTNDINALWAAQEQELDLLDTVRMDYMFHAYDAHPKRVKDVLARADPSSLKATLRGSEKKRAFETLDEAREVLKAEGINPIEDAAELMLRRGMRHIHAVETKNFFNDVAQKWGTLPDELEAGAAGLSSEMAQVAKLADEEADAVKAAMRPGVPVGEVRKLSTDGQREFLRRRFERVQNPLELENVVNKYHEFEHLFPETTNQATRMLKSAQGEGMRVLDLPEFKGITLPADIAQDVIDFNKHFIDKEHVPALLRAYDKFMNTFKVGVTSIFPAFHFRNAYSNVVQQFTDVGITALNPKMHADAVRMLAGYVNGSFVAKHGRRWGYGEVVYEAKRRGVMADYRNVFETFGDKIPIRTSKSKALDMVSHPVDTWKRFGGIVENEARLSLFTNYLRRGLDAETAAQRVNKVLFDYHNLSRIERDVLARMFPFYRWTRKNIALQAERLVKNPGQAATQAKLTRQQNTRPEDLPGYLRGELVFTLDTDEKGNLTSISGIDIPISDLNVLTEPMQLVMGNLSPGLKLIPELVSDQDFFHKRTISENSQPLIRELGKALDLLPERVKKTIEYSKRTLKDGTVEYRMNPTLTYVLVKSWALSRVYGTADRLLKSKSLVSTQNFLDVTTGIRLRDVDVDTAAKNLEYEYKRFLETKALAAGVRKRFSRTFKPKEKPRPPENRPQ